MQIASLILAAGLATRMQASKLSLPWGDTTVIGQVVRVLRAGGVDEIVVVTGGWRDEVEAALRGLPVRTVFNPQYADGEMLHSLQAGLRALSPGVQACLVALGDQPQIRAATVQRVLAAFGETASPLVVPSFHMRRGHPWLVARSLWGELLALQPPHTLRDFLNAHGSEIHYVDAPDESILLDLDTPDAYQRYRPS
ncbi:MAG: nucleotidyltransferase family protein [Anaerolineae bacterium]|nr:MAG: nucleotidyltransferase family protein [Anaerolineae bacterium]